MGQVNKKAPGSAIDRETKGPEEEAAVLFVYLLVCWLVCVVVSL